MSRRVVVTGMGAITPIGNSIDEFWNGLKEGKVGIDKITKFDTADFEVKLAAEVKGFVPKERMDFKVAKRMSTFSQYAVCASKEALEMAGINMENEDPYKVGVSIGSGIGGMNEMESEHQRLLNMGPSRVKPLLVPMMITNMAAGNVAIAYGLKGKNINVVTACATGTHAIGEAFRTIQYGDADVMLAGGTESAITPLGVAGFQSLTALSKQEDPTLASLPFDSKRSGFVMGEGAGIVVLEELEHALSRGANILAEVVGYGATCDAFHITSPAEDGSGAAKAMSNALADAGIDPTDVDYVNAHGTGTHHNDLFESRAINLALPGNDKVKVSSTKSMTGHLLGAAGGIEFIACVKSVMEDYIHHTAGVTELDPECNVDVVIGEGINTPVNVAISNSLGFGGHNATVAVKKFGGR